MENLNHKITAKPLIKKGNTFLCRKSLTRNGQELFTNNKLYRSTADHGITANCGTAYMGFNREMLRKHFVKN